MVGTFSSQLQSQQQETPITRTERKLAQQRQAEFEQSKAEAERLRTEEFVDKNIEKTYTYYVPKKYVKRDGSIDTSWWRKTEKARQKILNQTSAKNKIQFTGTKTVKDTFTFEDYQQAYLYLSLLSAVF